MTDSAIANGSAGSPPSTRSERPRIFISSTIYDFRDLRSALKYWLEGLNLEVMLSEVNDFAKSGDDNSYEACLKAIERSDYFVLLVGARVGGLYDIAKKISITRMEYRHAYECLQKGRLKIFAFVRNDIWVVREDRKALERILQDDRALTTEQSRDAILNHSSRIMNDASARGTAGVRSLRETGPKYRESRLEAPEAATNAVPGVTVEQKGDGGSWRPAWSWSAIGG